MRRPITHLLVSCPIFSQAAFALPPEYGDIPLSGYIYGERSTAILGRQSSTPLITTGVKTGRGPGGSLPLRIEIREMQKDATMWTLYILGLDYMQRNKDQSNIESWYQVAGIHGRPFKPYDNVQPVPGAEQSGYCEHVSILFLPWHRPYLALYEQILYKGIQYIASQYPEGAVRNKYVAAAVNFRMPYWDWAIIPKAGQSAFPSIFTTPSINVDGPSGMQNIWNPLGSYHFRPLDPSEFPDQNFNQYPQTVRYPSTPTTSAISQNNFIVSQLSQSLTSIRSRLYNLFLSSADFAHFSNEGWFDFPNQHNTAQYDSIETLHDLIHSIVGGYGHMTYIQYSAFDPLFWLHHTMVDRVWAMWQIMHPGTYVVPQQAYYNSFTMRNGSIQHLNSPLTPFLKDGTNFWTAADVKDTGTFGYGYKETGAGASFGTVLSTVITMYGF